MDISNRIDGSELKYVIFQVGGRTCAFSLDEVREVLPIVEFYRPPGMSYLLEGFFDLGGRAIPVLRLDRVLDLPEKDVDFYSHVLLLRGRRSDFSSQDGETAFFALLVDRVSSIAGVDPRLITPVNSKDSFNGCATGIVSLNGQATHVLSFPRLLLEKEQKALLAFTQMAQKRLDAAERESR